MTSSKSQYPGHLNPFSSDEETDIEPSPSVRGEKLVAKIETEYPDHLDPFNTNADVVDPGLAGVNDYDDSLNPFGIEDEEECNKIVPSLTIAGVPESINQKNDETNPFAEEADHETKQQDAEEDISAVRDESAVPQRSPSPDISEPPKPLPRTKSLLKKELAQKKRLQEQQTITDHQTNSLQSTTSSTSKSSMNEASNQGPVNPVASFQRQKNKRLAPPVPVNFKRQVSGSLDEIEEELEGIGDKLAVIDKESVLCQQTLTSSEAVTESAMQMTRSKYVELIKRRNSIVRRQRELMYKKRELKLDQLYSDIEYELRMIGNKQQSTRTSEDESKEKELLKKLVDIVEEKNDIVENLNKDTSCDSRDVDEAFRRLNIKEHTQDVSDKKHLDNATAQIVSRGEACDKKGIARLSKIATLLPRGDAIKMKRKRLFKKNCDSRPIER